MKRSFRRLSPTRCAGIVAGALLVAPMSGDEMRAVGIATAQSEPASAPIPDLAGIWDGSRRSHPTNSATSPWARTLPEGAILPDGTPAGKNYVSNFPELNERALAFQKIFDEPLSPTYDCQPSTPPAQ